MSCAEAQYYLVMINLLLSQSSKGGQPDQFWQECKTRLKSCYKPSSFRNHLLGWSVLLKKVKNQGVFGGYLLNFPLKNGPPLKTEILQYLDLGLLLEAEILLKCFFGTFFFFLYILQTRRDILQTGITEFWYLYF